MITLEQMKALKAGDTVYEVVKVSSGIKVHKWKVNSNPKRWKRNDDEVQVTIKHGLYRYFTLYEWHCSVENFYIYDPTPELNRAVLSEATA